MSLSPTGQACLAKLTEFLLLLLARNASLIYCLFIGKTHSLKHLNRVTSYTSVIAVPSSLFKNEHKRYQMGFARLKRQNIDRKKT